MRIINSSGKRQAVSRKYKAKKCLSRASTLRCSAGVTLIELIVFIIIVSISMAGLLGVFTQSMNNSVDPIIQVRLMEAAQSQLDEIMLRKYNESTPVGGVPACGSTELGAVACTGIGREGEAQSSSDVLDDVDDFFDYSDNPYVGYTRTVAINNGGTEIGLPAAADAKRITVTVTAPGGESINLSAYRANF